MKLTLTLEAQGEVKHTLLIPLNMPYNDSVLRELCDRIYFAFIYGPTHPHGYPAVEVEVVGVGIVRGRFSRRSNSNAAGAPNLWVRIGPPRNGG